MGGAGNALGRHRHRARHHRRLVSVSGAGRGERDYLSFLASPSAGSPPTGPDFLPPVKSISQFKVFSSPWKAGTITAFMARITHLPTAVSSLYGSAMVADLT